MLNQVFLYDTISQGRLQNLDQVPHNFAEKTGSSTNQLFIAYCIKRCKGINIKDIVIERTPSGKPVVKGFEDLHFNLSSSKGLLTCIVSEKPVGIDIEKDRTVTIDSKFNRFFSVSEWASLLSTEAESFSFFELWTCKESYSKFRGDGLNLPFSTFSINKYGKIYTVEHSSQKNAAHIQLFRLKENFYLAVCSAEKHLRGIEYVDNFSIYNTLVN